MVIAVTMIWDNHVLSSIVGTLYLEIPNVSTVALH